MIVSLKLPSTKARNLSFTFMCSPFFTQQLEEIRIRPYLATFIYELATDMNTLKFVDEASTRRRFLSRKKESLIRLCR